MFSPLCIVYWLWSFFPFVLVQDGNQEPAGKGLMTSQPPAAVPPVQRNQSLPSMALRKQGRAGELP